jgi:hypothetical protein
MIPVTFSKHVRKSYRDHESALARESTMIIARLAERLGLAERQGVAERLGLAERLVTGGRSS